MGNLEDFAGKKLVSFNGLGKFPEIALLYDRSDDRI